MVHGAPFSGTTARDGGHNRSSPRAPTDRRQADRLSRVWRSPARRRIDDASPSRPRRCARMVSVALQRRGPSDDLAASVGRSRTTCLGAPEGALGAAAEGSASKYPLDELVARPPRSLGAGDTDSYSPTSTTGHRVRSYVGWQSRTREPNYRKPRAAPSPLPDREPWMVAASDRPTAAVFPRRRSAPLD